MIANLDVPLATADPVQHADMIELSALFSKSRSSSFEAYARDIRISGTTDALTDEDFEEDPGDHGGEQSATITTGAWSEIERRAENCGGDAGFYPFEVTRTHIELKGRWQSSPYVFQMLLTQYGQDASTEPIYGARIFEKLSSVAAQQYFGGDANGAQSIPFGFPRPNGSNFSDALQDLCAKIREGVVNTTEPSIGDKNDGHLDVVSWIPFRDRQSSQLIAFGQCATGKNWECKLSELVPLNFEEKWLTDNFLVDPIKMFFIPRCVMASKWKHAAIDGGIIFDRCRIALCVGKPEKDIAKELALWTKSVVSEQKKAI